MCFKNEKKRHVLQLGKEEKMRSSQQLMTNSCQTTACGPNLVCPVFVHSFTGTQSYKFVYRLSMAFSVLQWEIWIAVTQVTWPTKPKIHTFFCLFFFSWLHPAACGILVPQPGTESMPLAFKVWSLHHWTTREIPISFAFYRKVC